MVWHLSFFCKVALLLKEESKVTTNTTLMRVSEGWVSRASTELGLIIYDLLTLLTQLYFILIVSS